mgnify:FL=1
MEKFKCFLVFADKNDSYITDKLQKDFWSIVVCSKLTDDTLYTWSEMKQYPKFMDHVPVPFCIDDNIAYFDPTGKAKEEGNQIVAEINYYINELAKIDIELTDIIYACSKEGHRDILAKTLRNASKLPEQIPEYTIDPSSESSIEKGIVKIKGISKEEVYIKKSDVLDILNNVDKEHQSHCINQLPEYIMEEESENEYDRD